MATLARPSSSPSKSNHGIRTAHSSAPFAASVTTNSRIMHGHYIGFFCSSKQRPFEATANSYRITSRGGFTYEEEEEEDESGELHSFTEAVSLFNKREYYKCHDVLESLWNESQEPKRTLVHGILQCAVGFHHLFNQNHKGAMMELGEGLCKLRKMNFKDGPFHRFEREISDVLEFIYQTQIELAACTEELCIAMDQSERSYQLLGKYAAGERLYHLEIDRNWKAYIVFRPERYRLSEGEELSIKIPVLEASEQHIMDFEYA